MKSVSFLGPEGSFSHAAASAFCPNLKKIAYKSFQLAVKALTDGETDYAVLPIENTLNGGVLQNLDLLQNNEGIIAVKELVLPIDHRLAYPADAKKEDIKIIYSHEQALQQCQKYLTENFPEAKLVACSSTSESIKNVKTSFEACIVGAQVKNDSFIFSKENIADEKNNFTHFLLIERGELSKDVKTNKVFFAFTCQNVSGALVSTLNKICNYNINMTKIESRPVKNRPDEYSFFIEVECDYSKEDTRAALKDILSNTWSYKILGAY